MNSQTADIIAYNGKIATQNGQRSMVEAVAIRDGKFLAVGTDREMMAWRGDQTQLINLNKRTAIPVLNDSHTHLIRGGLNYNLELRWDVWLAVWFVVASSAHAQSVPAYSLLSRKRGLECPQGQKPSPGHLGSWTKLH